jgi:hypothetical protein
MLGVITFLVIFLALREWRYRQMVQHANDWRNIATDACAELKRVSQQRNEISALLDKAIELGKK